MSGVLPEGTIVGYCVGGKVIFLFSVMQLLISASIYIILLLTLVVTTFQRLLDGYIKEFRIYCHYCDKVVNYSLFRQMHVEIQCQIKQLDQEISLDLLFFFVSAMSLYLLSLKFFILYEHVSPSQFEAHVGQAAQRKP